MTVFWAMLAAQAISLLITLVAVTSNAKSLRQNAAALERIERLKGEMIDLLRQNAESLARIEQLKREIIGLVAGNAP